MCEFMAIGLWNLFLQAGHWYGSAFPDFSFLGFCTGAGFASWPLVDPTSPAFCRSCFNKVE